MFPLSDPLPPTELKQGLSVVAEAIHGLSHWIDPTCKDAARLFYLPACHPEKVADFEIQHIIGDILNTETLQVLITHKKTLQERQRDSNIKNLSQYSGRRENSNGSIIKRFNDTFPLDAILQTHGYERKGKRWLSPVSSTKIAGIVVFEDGRMFSHHADLLGNQGTLLDPFEAFALLEHGGDKKAAIRAALRLMGI